MKWLVRGAVLLLTIVLFAFAWEHFEESRDASRFPNPGRLFDVNGHKLNLTCTGQGAPTVILEAGMTGISAAWAPIQRDLAGFTRVCSYDRAGYGRSEPGPQPRTSRQIATELQSLLHAAGIQPPYILAGASAGALHAHVYAGMYPNDIAGMVLVDPSHPDQAAKLGFPEDALAEEATWEPYYPVFHQFGMLRLAFLLERAYPRLNAADRAQITYLRDSVTSMRTLIAESAAFPESNKEARASGNLGDKPLIVLSGTRDLFPDVRKILVDDLHESLARLSSRGKHIVLADSGHGIQFERPDAVVSAIHDVFKQVTH